MGMKISENQLTEVLDNLYAKALDGIPAVSKSLDELANDYLQKNVTQEKAAKALINNQIAKHQGRFFLLGFLN